MADIDVVNAYMTALTVDDLPAEPAPGPGYNDLTTGVVNRVVQELQDPGGVHSARQMVKLAWEGYGLKFSKAQFQMIIDAYRARVSELTAVE